MICQHIKLISVDDSGEFLILEAMDKTGVGYTPAQVIIIEWTGQEWVLLLSLVLVSNYMYHLISDYKYKYPQSIQ